MGSRVHLVGVVLLRLDRCGVACAHQQMDPVSPYSVRDGIPIPAGPAGFAAGDAKLRLRVTAPAAWVKVIHPWTVSAWIWGWMIWLRPVRV